MTAICKKRWKPGNDSNELVVNRFVFSWAGLLKDFHTDFVRGRGA
jgi:hypothetical protein